jgi:hypothetical protein
MKIKLNKGLQLIKESLTKLEDTEMASVKGQGTTGMKCSCRRASCMPDDEVVSVD